jgi:hypothetical protein
MSDRLFAVFLAFMLVALTCDAVASIARFVMEFVVCVP